MPIILKVADLNAEELWRRGRNPSDPVLWTRNSARIIRLRALLDTAPSPVATEVTVDKLSLADLEDELEWRRGDPNPTTDRKANFERVQALEKQIDDIRTGKKADPDPGGNLDRLTRTLLLIAGVLGLFWVYLNLLSP